MTEFRVNYVPWHIGDWLSRTSMLSSDEYALYHRLLMQCYMRGGYITDTDIDIAIRWSCRNDHQSIERSSDDKRAMIATYFKRCKDGFWHNDRCDAEIAKMQNKSEKSRTAVETREKRRYADRTIIERSSDDKRAINEQSSGDKQTVILSNSQEPISNKPSKEGIGAAPSRSASPRARAASPTLNFYGLPEQLQKDWKTSRKKKLTQTAIDGVKREAEKAGITFEQAVRFLVERGWESFRASWWKNASSEEGTSEPDQSPEEAAYMEFRADEYAAGRIPCAFEEWKERFWDKRSEELPL